MNDECEQNHIEEEDVCGNCGKFGWDGACDSCAEEAQRENKQALDNPREEEA